MPSPSRSRVSIALSRFEILRAHSELRESDPPVVLSADDSKIESRVGAAERERHDVIEFEPEFRGATAPLMDDLALPPAAGPDGAGERNRQVDPFARGQSRQVNLFACRHERP